MLIDTDVWIWYMKGNSSAQEIIEGLPRFSMSVVTYMELVQGMRNKQELNILRKTLKAFKVDIIYINEEVSAKAMFLVEQYFLSHSMHLADALIAASAIANGLKLITGNDKHYRMIKSVELMPFRP